MEAVVKFFTDLSAQLPCIADALEAIAAKDPSITVNVQAPEVGPTPAPVSEYPHMPDGMRKPADIPLIGDDWSKGELKLIPWGVGPHSQGNPAMVDFRDNGSAVLTAKTISGKWNTGAMQFNKPTFGKGKAEAIVGSTAANSVCAVFGYCGKTSTEIDFEYTKKNGVKG